MQWTKQKKQLVSFFSNSVSFSESLQNNEKILFSQFYFLLKNAKAYLEIVKKTITFEIKEIIDPQKEIRNIDYLSLQSLPKNISAHIYQYIRWEILVHGFHVNNRKFHIFFFSESRPTKGQIWSLYLTPVIMWLYIVTQYAPTHCCQTLCIYFFLTSLEKQLPSSFHTIINAEHVNTGFTFTCKPKNEILIFRYEEWFKVFLHETFHAFGLDFSSMDCSDANVFIQRQLFHVSSKINLFEAYTEYWAEMWNIGFCAFLQNKEGNQSPSKKKYLSSVGFFLQMEQQFSFFQLVKILHFMRLQYNDICIHTNILHESIRYKEKSNVLSYYIIKTILLTTCNDFLRWSFQRNGKYTPFVFHQSPPNIVSFCRFLQDTYRSPMVLHFIEIYEKKLYNILKETKKTNLSFFLTNTMRMTLCEQNMMF